ncbi:MAG: hypothetical protein IID40_07505, partial [Planctomycetes bacterium]|nr:hypothetical protein [Planctomycetota bacterium]
HTRNLGRANILWLDGHAGGETLDSLGYATAADGSVALIGHNRLWHILQKDEPWTLPPGP